MGVFFTRPRNIAAAVRPRLLEAYQAQQQNFQEATTHADADTSHIEQETRPTFSKERFVCALILVIVLFLLSVYSAHDPKMASHSDALFHMFEVLTSGLTILLVGEAAAQG